MSGGPTGRPILKALDDAEPRPAGNSSGPDKKNYAERLSRHLATHVAGALRPKFPGITPDASGKQQETPARTTKGFKKLDVNYSTIELGLALGVSIKTLNFIDQKTGRYTKNYSRIDNELRAEGTDYHQRQPYSILVGVLFLPVDSCDDAGKGTKQEAGISSFGAAARYFRNRAGRETPHDDVDLFERFFIGLYEHDGAQRGAAEFFDVKTAPPRNRRPTAGEIMAFDDLIAAITATYNQRNAPPFEWAP